MEILMVDRDAILREVCELLKIWALVQRECGTNGWAGANAALVERINNLCEQMN
jgi:hypothetical protein